MVNPSPSPDGDHDVTASDESDCGCTIWGDCTIWGASIDAVRMCRPHHRYYRGDRELASVSRVLREIWPVKKSWDGVDSEVVEFARDRGVLVDHLLSSYVTGKPLFIPRGTRNDPEMHGQAQALFVKLRTWWDFWDCTAFGGTTVEAQVILANADIAGTCDLIIGGGVFDLKCTYSVELDNALQVGIYGLLYEHMYKRKPDSLGIIHVTKRYAKPKVINLPVDETMADSRTVLDMWRLVKRIAGDKCQKRQS